MTAPGLATELAAALAIAATASEELRRRYDAFVAIPHAPVSISTEADVVVQELILQALRDRFPADGLVAEERTATLQDAPRGARRSWVVDPIDGTRGFARKAGQFSVMIGLIEDGEPLLGVVGEPLAHRLTWAVRDGGCWTSVGEATPQRCTVSRVERLVEGTLARSIESGRSPLEERLGAARILRTYSAGLKLCLVARGEADLYPTRGSFHDWDLVAGAILVTEAGGTVSRANGSRFTFGQPGAFQPGGILASNGRVHGEALQAMRDLGVR